MILTNMLMCIITTTWLVSMVIITITRSMAKT